MILENHVLREKYLSLYFIDEQNVDVEEEEIVQRFDVLYYNVLMQDLFGESEDMSQQYCCVIDLRDHDCQGDLLFGYFLIEILLHFLLNSQ